MRHTFAGLSLTYPLKVLLAATLTAAGLYYLFGAPVQPGALGYLVHVTPTPFQPLAATLTPFAAVGSTRTVTPQPAPTQTPSPIIPTIWHGLDLLDSTQTIHIVIQPPAQVNNGRPVAVTFRPGFPCEYRNHRACIAAAEEGGWILATVHSGVGGEGQGLRNALEGTGINRASFSLDRIHSNLESIQGAPVSVSGGDQQVDGLQVLAAARIPPEKIDAYFAAPVDEALSLAAESSPALRDALGPGRQVLVIETCGWRHPAEPWVPGVSDTTGSIYLLVIG